MTDATEDLAPGYQAHRTQLAQASAAEQLLSRVRARPKKAGDGAPAAPSANPAQDAGKGEQGGLAGRVASDVGQGIVELPRAIVKGIRDGYQNTINLAGEFGTWVEEVASLPGFKVDADGISLVSGEELQKLPRPGFNLPDIAAPKSTTGNVVKTVTQFLTGMKIAGKAMKGTGVPPASGGAGYARTAAQGAAANFAAFDPAQQRLSNLIQEVPALANPVSEYLAAAPDDGAAEGRFKNAVEGLGFGVLADGFVKGVRVLREVARSRAAQQQAGSLAIEGVERGIDDDAFKLIGDTADDKLVRRLKPAPASAGTAKPPARTAAPAASGDTDEVFINFARIDAAEDVKRTMQELANLQKKAIATGGRGSRSFAQTKLDANQVDAWDVLTKRREGEPLNAEQSVAARELWVSASDRLSKAAQAAADMPSEANLFAFRKMLSVHDLVQREVIAARTETARALGSWRIPVGSAAERLRDVTGLIDAAGGAEASRDLASRIAALARAGQVREMNEVVRKTATATTKDAILEGWINGLLSAPATHAVNTTSNSSVMFLRMGERAVAGRIAALLGDDASVQAGEAAAQWHGMTSGVKDAFRYAAKAARTGESGMGMGKIEAARQGAITSEAFGLSSSGWLGRGTDLLGSLIRIPGRMLVTEDEFFKTLGYRMELHAQALRQAAADVHAGKIKPNLLKARIAELVETPPENVRMAAVNAATYQTFTDTPGKFAQAIGRLTNEYPLAKVILPFTRTPANIMRFTFERTPLAPLMGQFRANVAAGGARRDLALAQMGLGTMAMLSFADLTMSGQVTGRGPLEKGQRQALERNGWQPYSIKMGDRWYAYNRLDPVGSLVGLAADATETMMHAQHEAIDDPDVEKLAVASTIAFAGNIVNKTYLSGLSSIIEAMNDPQRSAEHWAQRLAGSVVPAGVAAANRLQDPYVREVNSMMDAIRARLPGLSDNLPARMNLWGEPLDTASGLGATYDLIGPARTRPPKESPIDDEILRIGANIVAPARKTSFNGVTVDLAQHPKAYSRYLQLAGNELKHPAWNMGAKDFLNAVVTGQHPLSPVYAMRSDGPDGGKDVFIRETLAKYRELARTQLLQEFPELADQVAGKQANQRALAMPVLPQ